MAFARAGAWLFLLAALVTMPTLLLAQATGTGLNFDVHRSSARFIVHLPLRMRAEGSIAGVNGELNGDVAHGWTVRVDADGRSLKMAGPRWIDRATRSDDFLAVDSHPAIRFQSIRFSDRLLHTGGRVRGQLTLRGLTRAVSFRLLPSACAHPGRDCDLQVNGIISRNAFGMTAHRLSVRDGVELHMRVRLQPVEPAR
ncbi:MAG: YceI family protein [Arenimonas sp.]